MKRTVTTARIAAAAAGGLILAGVAGAGVAFADEPSGEADVDLSVAIEALEEPGLLALSVGAGPVELTENGSDALVRQFTGTLPTVTVTDTRTAEEIPDGAYWYVLGSAETFTSAGNPGISAEYLGWEPRLTGATDPGEVAAGDEVFSAVDEAEAPDNVGLVDGELFAIASDSETIAPQGSWSATADLTLRVPSSVTAGEYSSTLTLSLFE